MQGRQALDNLHRLEADGDDLGDEAEDVPGVVGAIGVVGDAAAFVRADLVLVNDPFEGGTVPEPVFVSLGRDAIEGGSRYRPARSCRG